jgi:hypothetical protein
MPTVYATTYDHAVPGEQFAAEGRCEAVRDVLRAAGIDSTRHDEPPWLDAGNLSAYVDVSIGTMYVDVADEHVARAKALLDAPSA